MSAVQNKLDNPTDPMWALLAADLKVRNAGPSRLGVFRGAPSHSGADLLNALRELGWELQRTVPLPVAQADAHQSRTAPGGVQSVETDGAR